MPLETPAAGLFLCGHGLPVQPPAAGGTGHYRGGKFLEDLVARFLDVCFLLL
jgi:hypothetical protein